MKGAHETYFSAGAGEIATAGTSDKLPFSKDTTKSFVSSGILLFLDQMIIAAGGWFYWLVVSKLTTSSAIGQATIIYSIVLLTTTITQLGLEYPLLKRSLNRKKILGTTLVIELAISIASIPIVFYYVNSMYPQQEQKSILEFILVAVGILIFTSLGFVSRFALLGISDVKNVLIFDLAGTAIKFVSGYALVLGGFGTFGILVSFILHSVTIAGGTLFVARKTMGFGFGGFALSKSIVLEGLVNMPSKLSKMFILSLSIVLLASLGVSSSDTGIFYISVMISIAAGGFASSIAFMAIPASILSKADLSSNSMRLGLSFTAPIIVSMLVAPGAILAIIGPEYATAQNTFLVLALGILPSAIVTNAISKFNNGDQNAKILAIGISQLAIFTMLFFILVPQYGIYGASVAMLIAFTASAIPAIWWLESVSIKHIASNTIAILAGWSTGYVTYYFTDSYPLLAITFSIAVTMAINLKLKNITVLEIKQIIKARVR